MTKEGGRKGQKATGKDLVIKSLEKRHQSKTGFEGRNLADFFFEIFLTSCIIQFFFF